MKEGEKLKVRRPKLADSKEKKKSLICVAVAMVFTISFSIAGSYVMFGTPNLGRLKGAVCPCSDSKYKYNSKTGKCENTKTTIVNPKTINDCPVYYTLNNGKCNRL